MDIWTVNNKKQKKFLSKKTKPFDFDKISKKEINELVRTMREAMREANGIGLAANQIGLSHCVFVAEIPDENGSKKFYSIFNPEIVKESANTKLMEEGCLSVPGKYGAVNRHTQVTLEGQSKTGKKLKIKAWGLLAHVFQHETDHLDGELYINKTKAIYEKPTSERLLTKNPDFLTAKRNQKIEDSDTARHRSKKLNT